MGSDILTKHPRSMVTRQFLLPFILVTSFFLLWGVAHSLLDVLNKHFRTYLESPRPGQDWFSLHRPE